MPAQQDACAHRWCLATSTVMDFWKVKPFSSLRTEVSFMRRVFKFYHKVFAPGRYEGETSRGMPHGKGTYTDSAGLKHEGMFEYGLPHGRGTRSYADVNQLGKFEDGELQGNAVVIDLTLGRMEGQFNRSVPHGHIKSTVAQIKGTFDGYYMDGLRTGFGRLNFGNIDRDEKAKEDKIKQVSSRPQRFCTVRTAWLCRGSACTACRKKNAPDTKRHRLVTGLLELQFKLRWASQTAVKTSRRPGATSQ